MLIFTIIYTCLFVSTMSVLRGAIMLDRFYLCKKNMAGTVVHLSANNDPTCTKISFFAHKHKDSLVLNFVTDGSCSFLCIDKCGYMYANSKFHKKNCLFSVNAFNGFDTLSVHHGNYSNFIAAYDTMIVPLSLRRGAKLERLMTAIKVTFEQETYIETSCATLNLADIENDHECEETKGGVAGDTAFDWHRNYNDYSWWEKLMQLLRVQSANVPTKNEKLSYFVYN
ncbi:fibrobast growth factor 1 [Epinotia aporema granulovirus]|uniref:Fibrobast growth factor 1 n=1 Tax=Epinotia aporema granulovirus TaxID=166056 RepID=K4EQT5_9BBAC|nr:fibrobast growth factor 1 [Epinotia aporema granulovirus]AER41496.1 fibrobast growth factor 1 [Epinotia aporema granulovirus]